MQSLLDVLDQGLDAMNIDLPAGAAERMIDYIGLLNHWNRSFNLTAIREPEAMVRMHLLDSLAVLPCVHGPAVLDVGSGAGLPGIPLALGLPGVRFTLLDSNGKKTRFLTQARITLGLENVDVVNQRVEDYRAEIYFDEIIARAFASPQQVLKKTAALQGTHTKLLLMQGKLDTSVGDGYRVDRIHVLNVHGVDAERNLIEIVKS